MESPTPDTGTPSSQSPARTPPHLITEEELLRSMAEARSPSATSMASPAGPSSRAEAAAPSHRRPSYQIMSAAASRHPLAAVQLPPETELRAATFGGPVGPPRLPHQLSPALQVVLAGWRSVYESCRSGPALQALVGQCYAADAVFEDALVSVRGHPALFRQFALLGTAVKGVQVGAYSLSVAPVAWPVVSLPAPPPKPPASAAAPAAAPPASASGTPLHLTCVTVENLQCFQLRLPALVSRMLGGKSGDVTVPLYVSSSLLVASDAPLALPGGGGAAEQEVAAALQQQQQGQGQARGRGAGPAAAGPGAAAVPNWLIVHHVDTWHNVPTVWWALRRAMGRLVDWLLSPLLGL